ELEERLLARLEDPSPTVRLQSVRGLWQSWYWSSSDSLRARIEDRFLERMGIETDAWVRRSLNEGFYNICDENVRYLYNNWIPALGRAEDRQRATEAHQAVGTRQARAIVRALAAAAGTPREAQLRENLLASLTEFHLRHSDPAHPETTARIGND